MIWKKFKLLILVTILLATILLISCTPQQPFCKNPYIEFQTGQCCLDANSNSICDRDEEVEEKIVKEKEETTLQQTQPMKLKISPDEFTDRRLVQLTAISPSIGQAFLPGEIEVTYYYNSVSKDVDDISMTVYYYVDGAYKHTINQKGQKKCPIGYDQECSITLDLTNFPGKRIGLFGSVYVKLTDEFWEDLERRGVRSFMQIQRHQIPKGEWFINIQETPET